MKFSFFSGPAFGSTLQAAAASLASSATVATASSSASSYASSAAAASANTTATTTTTTATTATTLLAVAIALPLAVWLWFNSGSSGRPGTSASSSTTRQAVPGEFPGSSAPSSPAKSESNTKKKKNKKKNKKSKVLSQVQPINTTVGAGDADNNSDDIELVSVPNTPSAPGPRQLGTPPAVSSKPKSKCTSANTIEQPEEPTVHSHDSESHTDSEPEDDWVAVPSSAPTGAQAAQRIRRRNKHYAPISEHEQWARLARPDPKRSLPGFAALATTTKDDYQASGLPSDSDSDSDPDPDSDHEPKVTVPAPKTGQPRVLTLIGSTPAPPPVCYKPEPVPQGLTKSQRKHLKNREKQRLVREAERKVQEQRHFNYRMEQMRAQDAAAKEKKLGKPRVIKATDGGVWKTGKGEVVRPVPDGGDKVAEAFLWGGMAASPSSGGPDTGGSSSSVVDSGVHHVSASPQVPPKKNVNKRPEPPAWTRGKHKVDPYHLYHPAPDPKDERVAEDFHEQPVVTSSSSSTSSILLSSPSSSNRVSPTPIQGNLTDLVAQQLLWGGVATEMRENEAEEVEGGTWMQPNGKRRQQGKRNTGQA